MNRFLPEKLIELANYTPTPLYVVGGFVRDFLSGMLAENTDIDVCSATDADTFSSIAKERGFQILSVYKNTGTVKLRDSNGRDYEYTCFRSDKYVRGIHRPVSTFFTTDITLDAKRRDFTANAVYYDIKEQKFIDPLNDGISAIKEKRLTTVDNAKKVFGEDGLRLLRLARQCATLGFTPDESCLDGATQNASLLKDISAERIYQELLQILSADKKHGLVDGAYNGLKLLDKTRTLDVILPELALGRNMSQRQDFHRYDVLEHTLRSVRYASPSVRLAALLHDVGKPFCLLRDGNFYEHAVEGARIATDILTRLKAPTKTIKHVSELVLWHMYDLDCKTGETKLRKFLVGKSSEFIEDLMLLKQADYSGCKDDVSTAPTVEKWRLLLAKMQKENVPMQLNQLAIKGNELIEIGVPAPSVSTVLYKLLAHTAVNPTDNRKEKLLTLALKLL